MKKLINDSFTFCKFRLDATTEEILSAVSALKDTVHDGSPIRSAKQISPLEPVDIPHDFLIGQVQDLYESCIGVYVRSIPYDGSDDHVFLRFDGVYMDSRYYINGIALS